MLREQKAKKKHQTVDNDWNRQDKDKCESCVILLVISVFQILLDY